MDLQVNLTRKIAQRLRQGNGAEDLLIFERHDAVMKTSNGMKGRKEPCWEKESAGALLLLLLLLLWAQLEKKLQPSGFSDHGRTDQLEDRNIILNNTS